MADGIFNIARGRISQFCVDDNTKFLMMLMKASEADATLIDYDDVAALLVPAGNTEADFTNYARKTALTVTRTVDDTNDRTDYDIPDQTWTTAGGGTNNTLTKAVVAYEVSAADSGRVPCSHHDFTLTTDGSNMTINIAAAGFARSA